MVGLLQGKGIKVYVPSASSLLKQYKRYGYSIDARPAASLKALLMGRTAEYRRQEEKLIENLSIVRGAKQESEALVQIAEGLDHGADIVLMPQLTELPKPVTPVTS